MRHVANRRITTCPDARPMGQKCANDRKDDKSPKHMQGSKSNWNEQQHPVAMRKKEGIRCKNSGNPRRRSQHVDIRRRARQKHQARFQKAACQPASEIHLKKIRWAKGLFDVAAKEIKRQAVEEKVPRPRARMEKLE